MSAIIFDLNFLYIFTYAEMTIPVPFSVDSVPIDLGGKTNWELLFGRGLEQTREPPSIKITQEQGDITPYSPSSSGILIFRFRPKIFSNVPIDTYKIALNYREEGILKPFAIGSATLRPIPGG